MTQARVLKIPTLNFGDLEVPEDKIVSFQQGIPGFPQLHRFAILEMSSLDPFFYLQALEDPPVALLVVNPFLIKPDYQFQISPSDMEDIRAESTESVSIYVVATVPEDPGEATVNLLAPILINTRDRCGKQVILPEAGYSVRQPLVRVSPVEEPTG